MKQTRRILVHAGWSGPAAAAKTAAERVAHASGLLLEVIPTESAAQALAPFGFVETDFQGWAEAVRIEGEAVVFRCALAGRNGPDLVAIAEFMK